MELESVSECCVNCGSYSASILLEDEEILHCIQQWTAPRLVQAHNVICTTCLTEARATASTPNVNHIGKECALCHVIMAKHTRSHHVIALRTDTAHHLNIKNIILENLLPLQVCATHYICHPCWQRTDRAAKRKSLSRTSSSASPLKCANCCIHLNKMKRHILHNETILSLIQRRVAPRVVSATDYICDACHTMFDNDTQMASEDSAAFVGHQKVCIQCGCSVVRLRHSIVQDEKNQHILNVVESWIHPQEIKPLDVICHRCFQRAEAVFRANAITASIPVPQETGIITLQNYSRAPDTHSRCLFPACNSTSQQMVPLTVRVKLFIDHNYYIPPHCRICRLHLESQNWSLLFEAENTLHYFTAAHIEDFVELLKKQKVANFRSIFIKGEPD